MKTGRKNNRGFTLVEIIIVVAIFTILMGIMAPSLNSILGFRVQRTVGSIAAGLDKAKTEAMSRLVGEMELSRKEDGYYISYHLDRGKNAVGGKRMAEDQAEKIAPRNMLVQIKLSNETEAHEMIVGERLILTYDRSDGSFRPVQTEPLTQEEINTFLDVNCTDVEFKDLESGGGAVFCEEIIVSGGFRKRTVTLNSGTGSYTITAG